MDESIKDAGWRAHDAEQLRAWRRLSYRERLTWLWQAKLFAARAMAAANLRAAANANELPRR